MVAGQRAENGHGGTGTVIMVSVLAPRLGSGQGVSYSQKPGQRCREASWGMIRDSEPRVRRPFGVGKSALCSLPRAAVRKYCKLGGALPNRNLFSLSWRLEGCDQGISRGVPL